MRAVKGAVLSGGDSKRMGRAKGNILLPWGLTMEANAKKLLTGVTEDCPVVSGGRGIIDVRPGNGPLGGIETILWREEAEAWLFMPCDMPFLSETILRKLVMEFMRDRRRPAVIGRPSLEPLLAVVPVTFREKVTNALDMGHLKVGRFWMDCGFSSVTVPDHGELHDVDHPWELPA